MKNFLRTYAGKSILYAITILSLVTLILSVCGAGYMIYAGYYRNDEEELREIELKRYAENEMMWLFYNNFDFETGNFKETMQHDDGNFIHHILDENGNVVVTSKSSLSEYKYREYFTVEPVSVEVYDTEPVEVYDTEAARYSVTSHSDSPDIYEDLINGNEDRRVYTIEGGLNPELKYVDEFSLFLTFHHTLYSLKTAIYPIGILAFVLMIASLIALMCVAGRRPKKEEIVPWYFHKVPYEFLLLPFIFAFLISAAGANGDGEIVVAVMGIMSLFFPLLCMSTVVRIKTHTLLKNTVTYRILSLTWKLLKAIGRFIITVIKNMGFLYKLLIVLFLMMFFWMIMICIHALEADLVMFLLTLFIVIPAIIIVALQINKLKKGAKELASGNFDHVIDTKHMLPELKKHADNLNNIAEGQKIAIDAKVRSERMKTELITNVSHDIKTPLTSIINYADLISKEETTSEKGKEYSEVLVRQSTRLKTLLEDLVEASKASTGNLEVDLQPCDAQIFVTQCAGEFEEKFKKADLTLITSVPEGSIRIMADGRRMQRIFDNLLNNACKYSLPGTRVYVDLQDTEKDAVFVFKNTSKDALNMTEEELMERFTRGDSSRNTEGSGLGLSIAGNLAELQNGKLRLSTDGDLFKATLSFPKI